MRLGVPMLAALVVSSASASAQIRVVAGRVSDAQTGRPIASGAVRVRETGYEDRLRPDGVFVVRVPRTRVRLVVSAPGYRPRTVIVPADAEAVLIELAPEILDLDDVVVAGWAGQPLQRTVTAGAEVELTAAPASTIDEALQGKVAGADIQRNSGSPGGGWGVQLRGLTSLNGSARPLYVVDGMIVSDFTIGSGVAAVTFGQEDAATRVADLPLHDVARVEVLRGPAATARFGSLGAHGVVLITTRRAASRPPSR